MSFSKKYWTYFLTFFSFVIIIGIAYHLGSTTSVLKKRLPASYDTNPNNSISILAHEASSSRQLSNLFTAGGKNSSAMVSRIRFNKNVLVKNGEDDVWFQGGEMFHNRKDIDRSMVFCKLDTDEDELSGLSWHNDLPLKKTNHGIVIKAGMKRAIGSINERLTKGPMPDDVLEYDIYISFIQDELNHMGNFVDDLRCQIPISSLKVLTAGDLKEITGGVLTVDSINIEE